MSILDKASLIQIPSGYKSTKLYSLRPSNGDGDFTFARSSSATRVNSEGLIETAQVLGSELVTNGDFSNGGANWVVSNSDATHYVEFSEDGARFVSDTTSPILNLGQGISLTSGNKYRFSIRLRNNGGTGNIKIDASGLGFVPNILDGTYTQDIVLTTNQSVVSFYRNGADVDLYIEDFSIKEVFENDVPRLDYSGGASCASLLLENQATNLITYSEIFNTWSKAALSNVAVDEINPMGSLSAQKITQTASGGYLWYPRTFAGNETFSFFVKKDSSDFVRLYAAGNSVFFDIVNGTVTSETGSEITDKSIIDYGNGWFRISISVNSTASNVRIYPASSGTSSSGTNSLFVWGAQLEQGSYPTSYIISNSGSSTTRSADVCNGAGTSATFNDSEGVLFFEGAALADDGTNRIITISDGSVNNRILIKYDNIANRLEFYVYSLGLIQCSFITTSLITTSNNKIAIKYKQNDFKLWANGVEVETDTSGNTPVGLSKLSFDDGIGNNDFYGNTKQLMVFDEALSDEELSDLTGQVNLSFNNLATFYGYTIL